ncbi:MAG: SH3 domain-containing protein [Phycisphaerales bacterium]|nr:SH3 domain-containing protein [Phycisphaerales bacterium]
MRQALRISQATVFSCFAFVSLVQAQTKTSSKTTDFPWEGEVTGTNVYVRSGAGTNYYPTTKLNTGDRVLVHGEKFGWYRISPPARSFSYIDKAKADRAPQAAYAIVNADQVYARAGSHLVSRKSNTQVMLSKGMKVEVIGEADGFLKIKPPPQAFLYMSKQYIRKVPKTSKTGLAQRYMAKMKAPVKTQPAKAEPPKTTAPPVTARKKKEPEPVMNVKVTANKPVKPTEELDAGEPEATGKTNPADPGARIAEATGNEDLSAAPVTRTKGRYQALLTTVESDLTVVMRLPLEKRELEPLIQRYEEIANQDEERIPSEYAKIRLRQLRNVIALRKAKSEIASDAEALGAYRADMTSQRMNIKRARFEKTAPVKFDLEGELRKSYAFAPQKHRYRLVDPKQQTTIAYVDIPPEVKQNVDHMIGKRVGIRISGQRFSPSARIPIAEATSITDLSMQNPGSAVIIPSESSNPQNTQPKIVNSMTMIKMEPVRSDSKPTPSNTVAAVEPRPEQE